MRKLIVSVLLLAMAANLTGCRTVAETYVWAWELIEGTSETNPPADPATQPETPANQAGTDIPAGCKFVGGADVSGWPVTATLQASVSVTRWQEKDPKTGKMVDRWKMPVTLRHEKVNVWPANGDGLNANPWIIVQFNGQWYAGNWEWIRKGQTVKDMGDKTFGSHVKAHPFPGDWNPAKGQKVGLMVSALSRGSSRSVKERTQVVWITWP